MFWLFHRNEKSEVLGKISGVFKCWPNIYIYIYNIYTYIWYSTNHIFRLDLSTEPPVWNSASISPKPVKSSEPTLVKTVIIAISKC